MNRKKKREELRIAEMGQEIKEAQIGCGSKYANKYEGCIVHIGNNTMMVKDGNLVPVKGSWWKRTRGLRHKALYVINDAFAWLLAIGCMWAIIWLVVKAIECMFGIDVLGVM